MACKRVMIARRPYNSCMLEPPAPCWRSSERGRRPPALRRPCSRPSIKRVMRRRGPQTLASAAARNAPVKIKNVKIAFMLLLHGYQLFARQRLKLCDRGEQFIRKTHSSSSQPLQEHRTVAGWNESSYGAPFLIHSQLLEHKDVVHVYTLGILPGSLRNSSYLS